jgi:cell division protease FtsH
MAMGGRAAEQLALNTITGGAKNDIEQATTIARDMVSQLGMSEALGPVAWGGGNDQVFLGRSLQTQVQYSEDTAERIDGEVRRILSRAYESATAILTSNIHVLHRVAQALIDQENLDHDEFRAIVDEAGPVLPDDLFMVPA